jgi:hypothetical protein
VAAQFWVLNVRSSASVVAWFGGASPLPVTAPNLVQYGVDDLAAKVGDCDLLDLRHISQSHPLRPQ